MAVTLTEARLPHGSARNARLQKLTQIIEGTFGCMEAAYKAGVNFFDCAEGYAEGTQQMHRDGPCDCVANLVMF